MAVPVLDRGGRPLDPCSEKRARQLLDRGRARVVRMFPFFVIRLVDRTVGESVVHDHEVRIDPGSKTTGIAVVRKTGTTTEGYGPDVVVRMMVELKHRGWSISKALKTRAAHRRYRRSNLRFRQPRFYNRTRRAGWLPPSLQHRVDTTLSIVAKLRRVLPISSIEMEVVRFDTQLMQNPEISGVEYQQGELRGYEVREYVLEKFHRTCVYCGVKDVPLQVEHVLARALGGSDRVSNLTLACEPCNVKKGALPLAVFLKDRPELLASLQAQLKRPLRDAAAVNATRWALFRALGKTGLPLSRASGGRTKWNRTSNDIPKTHALDAACVGETGTVSGWNIPTTTTAAMGRGRYSRTLPDRYGFPRAYLSRTKRMFGFATGDLVVADVSKGRHAGRHVGRVAVRASGNFVMTDRHGVKREMRHTRCRLVQHGDGYAYGSMPSHSNRENEARLHPDPKGRAPDAKI